VKKKVPSRPRNPRTPSASGIARNVKHFETWATHQNCEQISYTDLPADIRDDVHAVFDVVGRLPLSWTDKTSKEYDSISKLSSPGLISFLHDAFGHCPALFCEDDGTMDLAELYSDITIVYSAWRRLRYMRQSNEKWSEADFVANVYNIFRSPAIRKSTQRVHCTISLPQPLVSANMGSEAVHVLSAKTAVPDSTILIPGSKIRSLSHSAKSPFKVLKGQKAVVKSGSADKGSSFRYQSTPCASLPDSPGFEFASSFWEDKKPVHQMLEDAYRQNRLATTSAVRHLHSLCIKAPVFGLLWANGSVRAHVDWCKAGGKVPVVLSAPYPGDQDLSEDDEDTSLFHEWQLDRPSDILQVYFLIRNLDVWTTGKFRDRVVGGVKAFADNVVHKKQSYHPWKRIGTLAPSKVQKENIVTCTSTASSSTSTSTASPFAEVKGKRRR